MIQKILKIVPFYDLGIILSVSLLVSLLLVPASALKPQTGESLPLPNNMPSPKTTDPSKAISLIDFEGVKYHMNNPKKAVIIDARDELFFGMGHIPGAINFPLPSFEGKFQQLLPQVSGSDIVIIYCARESCTDSQKLAELLLNKGVKNLYVYKAGFEDWEKNEKIPQNTNP
jgi:rhodanese-related sulfurtransferase